MRKLKPYNEDSFEFYEAVVNSKKNSAQDPNYKERLQAHEALISDKFDDYDEGFDDDDLVSLVNHGFINQDKTDLIKLYSYKSKKMQKLKIAVTTTERNRLLSTCQNCTISEVNSFDHFVNKDEFPEFSVHPKNLFPSCTKCNSYKGQDWRDQGQLTYLNLYLDDLPEEQYLFVDINIAHDDAVSTKFYLDNPHDIDDLLFTRIENHYKNLHLCKRFQENADTVITSLENTIRTYSDKLPIEDIIDLVLENAERDIQYYGYNYWKSILELAMVESDDFLEMILND
ncbi:hypothetical protein [uncultured Psychroserpens sp.]|uniref:hypothetical protein n=1 Tax=uncultured Psychroserpens sp. TaxID=255436 RepID=UPI002638B250|nr:hypothetical protein [uncultured Psychroserpens sp.]